MARKSGSTSEITGPRVKAAALRLFARQGYAAVSMRLIAAEVGVQVGALYLYTADKQALLYDLLDEHMQALGAALAALPPVEGPVARLAQFARFHILFHLDRPDAVFLSYMELRNLTPENFVRIEAARRAYEDHLEAILAEGRRAGVFTVPDTRLAAFALIAMLTGVVQWFREGGRLSREDVAAAYTDMALGAVNAALPVWPTSGVSAPV